MLKAEVNQSLLRGGAKVPLKSVEKLFKIISCILPEKNNWQVSIAFVEQKEIKKHNRDYRGKNQVTDVLSFTHHQGDFLGEILICYDQAKKQATEKGINTRDEVIILITHGLLHLLDYDHQTKKEAKIMYSIQDWIYENYQTTK
ncbi:MAG: rRNA maturation RNase YbeY [Candidatus Uhrbacteria bacterium]